MKRTLKIGCFAVVGLMLIFLVIGIISSTTNGRSKTSITATSSDDVFHTAWLEQRGSGMFFGTAPDLTTGTSDLSCAFLYTTPGTDGSFGTKGSLNVMGLSSQFLDSTTLWMKFTCPGGNFNSLNVLFRVEKTIGGTMQYVTEFSVPVNPNAGIVRFQMPPFSIGPGKYMISAFTSGELRLSRYMAYLAQGQEQDAKFSGGY
jgi:hypothetical protein